MIVLVICLFVPVKQEGGGALPPMHIEHVEHPEPHNPKSEYNMRKDRPITMFQTPLPLKSVQAPAKNGSKKTLDELKYLQKLALKSTDEKREQARAFEQMSLVDHFIKYAGENGLMYDEQHLRDVAKDVETFGLLMKTYYNRPRPYQIGMLANMPINPVTMARSSSFPCEKTMIANVLANQLIHNNPSKKDVLQGMAKEVELSRYYGGLNYPSDTIEAIRIADIIGGKIKYLE